LLIPEFEPLITASELVGKIHLKGRTHLVPEFEFVFEFEPVPAPDVPDVLDPPEVPVVWLPPAFVVPKLP
jgi:hypothetical protein